MNQAFIYLASASPRRRELLRQIGVAHRVHAVDIDEDRHGGETPRDYVARMAHEKAHAAVLDVGCEVPVLAADTSVVVDGETLGKPAGRDDGLAMLARLSGRAHSVLTAVAVVDRDQTRAACNETRVEFRALDEAERQAYWESGEPHDKAGGYAIQGIAAVFVERIVGSYSAVMGLPLFETARLLRASGIAVLGGAGR